MSLCAFCHHAARAAGSYVLLGALELHGKVAIEHAVRTVAVERLARRADAGLGLRFEPEVFRFEPGLLLYLGALVIKGVGLDAFTRKLIIHKLTVPKWAISDGQINFGEVLF